MIGVIHRAVFFELLHNLRNGRGLLADRDIDADNVLALLVDDRIDRDGRFAGLAVADDQLALAAADGHHRVDSFQAGLKRLFHRLAVDDAGSDTLDRVVGVGDDLALAVDRVAERIDHAADHGIAHGHAHDAAGALDLVAFFDLLKVAEEHASDLVFFEVEREAANFVGKFEQLARHDLFEAVDLGDTVADLDHRSDLVRRSCSRQNSRSVHE